jgi:hypothetical protein
VVLISRYLAQEADVSYYGSSMAVINGEDGSWILRETHNASDLFKLRNNTDNSSAVACKKYAENPSGIRCMQKSVGCFIKDY